MLQALGGEEQKKQELRADDWVQRQLRDIENYSTIQSLDSILDHTEQIQHSDEMQHS